MLRIVFMGEPELCNPKRIKKTLKSVMRREDSFEFITTMKKYEFGCPYGACFIRMINRMKETYPHKKIVLVRAAIDDSPLENAAFFDKTIVPIPPGDAPFYRKYQTLNAWLHNELKIDIVISQYDELINPSETKELARFVKEGVEVINIVERTVSNQIYELSQRLPDNYARTFYLLKTGRSIKEISLERSISVNRVYQMIRKGRCDILDQLVDERDETVR